MGWHGISTMPLLHISVFPSVFPSPSKLSPQETTFFFFFLSERMPLTGVPSC